MSKYVYVKLVGVVVACAFGVWLTRSLAASVEGVCPPCRSSRELYLLGLLCSLGLGSMLSAAWVGWVMRLEGKGGGKS